MRLLISLGAARIRILVGEAGAYVVCYVTVPWKVEIYRRSWRGCYCNLCAGGIVFLVSKDGALEQSFHSHSLTSEIPVFIYLSDIPKFVHGAEIQVLSKLHDRYDD